jgi:uncharacterized protein (TIGR00369 family)
MDLLQQYITNNHFGNTLGMDFKVIEPGLVHYFLKIRQEHLSTPKASHGGVIAALMDGLLGVSCLSAIAADFKVVSTVEYKINFLAPALLHDELMGIGKVEQQGKRLMVASGDIICPARNNMVIAKAIGTFNAYPAEKAGFIKQ